MRHAVAHASRFSFLDQTRAREPSQSARSLIVAAIDGLSLQVATDPDGVDLDETFAVLAEMV